MRGRPSHQCVPGSIPARCDMWFEIDVGSRLSLRSFSPLAGYSDSARTEDPYEPAKASVDSSLNIEEREINTVFLSSYTNTSGSLGEREMLWEHEPLASVSTAFSSSPKLSGVFV